ncbi:MAG: hypothetical protein ACREXS_12855 [Gammaproteobacteria bacterium]
MVPNIKHRQVLIESTPARTVWTGLRTFVEILANNAINARPVKLTKAPESGLRALMAY